MGTRPRLSQWIALAAAGGAAFYGASRFAAPDAADSLAEPVVRADSARTAAAPATAEITSVAASAPLAGPPARAAIEVGGATETFGGMSWTPPPPPPPAPTVRPPPPPSAPAMPFRFIGMLEQKSDRPTAFLAKGEALLVVRVGDVIDSMYRIESLSPAQVVVTYLPLNQRQTLSVAGGQP
jgi:hypothetical protein